MASKMRLHTSSGTSSTPDRGCQCWDNALAESFFGAIKGKLPNDHAWRDRTTARHAVTGYIAWYNGTRLHSAPDTGHLPNTKVPPDKTTLRP